MLPTREEPRTAARSRQRRARLCRSIGRGRSLIVERAVGGSRLIGYHLGAGGEVWRSAPGLFTMEDRGFAARSPLPRRRRVARGRPASKTIPRSARSERLIGYVDSIVAFPVPYNCAPEPSSQDRAPVGPTRQRLDREMSRKLCVFYTAKRRCSPSRASRAPAFVSGYGMLSRQLRIGFDAVDRRA